MPIEFPCSQCRQLLRTPDSSAGKQARCPHCGSIQPIPPQAAEVNPYQSPQGPLLSEAQRDYSEALNQGMIRGKVQGPALALVILSSCVLAMSLLGMAVVGIGTLAEGGDFELFADTGGLLLNLPLYGTILLGALKMRKLENYGLALTAAILAMLPCSGCCVLGLPFGIWAIVVLSNPSVKSSFR